MFCFSETARIVYRLPYGLTNLILGHVFVQYQYACTQHKLNEYQNNRSSNLIIVFNICYAFDNIKGPINISVNSQMILLINF